MIDDEEIATGVRRRRHFVRDGAIVWFRHESGIYFEVRVERAPGTYDVTIRPTTGRSPEGHEWPYDEGLSFTVKSTMYKRLCPWDARKA